METKTRVGTRISLLAAPATLVASELLYVSTPDDPASGLAVIDAHESRWLLANILGLLAAALFVPVITTLMTLPRQRGRVLGRVGGVLGMLGVAGYAAHTGVFVVIGALANQHADRPAMARLVTALEGNAAMGIVLLFFLVGLYLGLVLLMIGAARARSVPRWTAACVTAAVVLGIAPLGVDAVAYAAEAMVVVGLGGAGWHLGRVARVSTYDDPSSAARTSPSLA